MHGGVRFSASAAPTANASIVNNDISDSEVAAIDIAENAISGGFSLDYSCLTYNFLDGSRILQ